MAAPSGELTLEMKRVLPTAPAVVFGLFSDSHELAKWWGPEGFTAPSVEFDPRVGGSYRIEMQPRGDARARGVAGLRRRAPSTWRKREENAAST
jgi:uncharacterized protein YndB with AHSA1/START domain